MNTTSVPASSAATATQAAPAPGADPAAAAATAAMPALSAPAAVSVPASGAALLTPEQLALRLNISRRCLSNWTRDRRIPMIKIGRVCRFDLPQVLAALDRHVQGVATR